MHYESTLEYHSTACEGVTFRIRRISFAGRLELLEGLQHIAGRAEFLRAGDTPKDRWEATILEKQVERGYLEWSLVRVDGLTIDGEPATPQLVVDRGPDGLTAEILSAVRSQLGLTEDER